MKAPLFNFKVFDRNVIAARIFVELVGGRAGVDATSQALHGYAALALRAAKVFIEATDEADDAKTRDEVGRRTAG